MKLVIAMWNSWFYSFQCREFRRGGDGVGCVRDVTRSIHELSASCLLLCFIVFLFLPHEKFFFFFFFLFDQGQLLFELPNFTDQYQILLTSTKFDSPVPNLTHRYQIWYWKKAKKMEL